MGNVLRVLGIVLASMLLGLVGLFLLLFTICGGLKETSAGGVLAVCLLLIAGCIGLIVFLGRGIASARAVARGLAVPPVGAPPAYGSAPVPAAPSIPGYDGPMITPPPPQAQAPYAPAAPAGYAPASATAASAARTRPVLPLRPMAGTDLQALIGLRVVLALYVVLSIGSMIYNVATFGRYGGGLAMQLVLRSVLTSLPAMVALIAVSVRNPPAGAALDTVAGYGIASIVFRFGYLAFVSTFNAPYFREGNFLLAMLPRLAGYSLLEAGIAGVALYLRSRVGPIGAPALIVATLAFLMWEGLVQAIMSLLIGAMF